MYWAHLPEFLVAVKKATTTYTRQMPDGGFLYNFKKKQIQARFVLFQVALLQNADLQSVARNCAGELRVKQKHGMSLEMCSKAKNWGCESKFLQQAAVQQPLSASDCTLLLSAAAARGMVCSTRCHKQLLHQSSLELQEGSNWASWPAATATVSTEQSINNSLHLRPPAAATCELAIRATNPRKVDTFDAAT